VAKIKIDGVLYIVTENLGFQNGFYAKAVETEDGERIAVKRCGEWTFWTSGDRLQARGSYGSMSDGGKKRRGGE
jgi:hypothetical protein